jgi:hypothetical protein
LRRARIRKTAQITDKNQQKLPELVDSESNARAIPRGKIVKTLSSKRSVKSKPVRQELATVGPNVSSTVIEQGVPGSDMADLAKGAIGVTEYLKG